MDDDEFPSLLSFLFESPADFLPEYEVSEVHSPDVLPEVVLSPVLRRESYKICISGLANSNEVSIGKYIKWNGFNLEVVEEPAQITPSTFIVVYKFALTGKILHGVIKGCVFISPQFLVDSLTHRERWFNPQWHTVQENQTALSNSILCARNGWNRAVISPFQDWMVAFVLKDLEKKEIFSSLIEAGGGNVVDFAYVQNNLVPASHIFVHTDFGAKSANKFLAKNIPVLPISFIVPYIMEGFNCDSKYRKFLSFANKFWMDKEKDELMCGVKVSFSNVFSFVRSVTKVLSW